MKPIKAANKITRVWREAGPGSYPIQLPLVIEEIINQSSGGDRLETSFRQADNFEGALVGGKSRVWCAVVNTNISSAGRRSFTLAHEIGHFVGHRAIKKEFQDTSEQLHDFETDPLEAEANEFAAQLLMPQDVVRPFTCGRFDVAQLEEMRHKLAVSRQAAGLRWVNVSASSVGFVVARDGCVVWGRASDAAYKRGVYFKSGNEVPANSATVRVQNGEKCISQVHGPGCWHGQLSCREDVYATSIGYTYTCLEYFG